MHKNLYWATDVEHLNGIDELVCYQFSQDENFIKNTYKHKCFVMTSFIYIGIKVGHFRTLHPHKKLKWICDRYIWMQNACFLLPVHHNNPNQFTNFYHFQKSWMQLTSDQAIRHRIICSYATGHCDLISLTDTISEVGEHFIFFTNIIICLLNFNAFSSLKLLYHMVSKHSLEDSHNISKFFIK